MSSGKEDAIIEVRLTFSVDESIKDNSCHHLLKVRWSSSRTEGEPGELVYA